MDNLGEKITLNVNCVTHVNRVTACCYNGRVTRLTGNTVDILAIFGALCKLHTSHPSPKDLDQLMF